ncbi:MAG: polysaccharide deacetylase family protein [Gemmataceae bacterium]|nr:polysaccharide deacetylase family protein [Gemmataceae bacterium]
MGTPAPGTCRLDPAHSVPRPYHTDIILSFDVEEHFRIEAAAALSIDPALKAHYCDRLEPATRWLLDQLARFDAKATFFVVGQIARSHPGLVRAMAQAGHEVASHSWDHRRAHHFTPATFREDLRASRDALEQVTSQPVVGFRAPTFSVVPQTAWAIDVLAELDFAYDSSIYPVWHDRYGVPRAPRAPFRVRGEVHELLEIPPATWRVLGTNLPVGGGGYFRLLPLFFMERALAQVRRSCRPAVAMLYFHPWEFDPRQARLPLGWLSKFRTYVGISRTRTRLRTLLARHRFDRAIDVAKRLDCQWQLLPRFFLTAEPPPLEVPATEPEERDLESLPPFRRSTARLGESLA